MNVAPIFAGIQKAQALLAAFSAVASIVTQVEQAVVASGLKIPGADKLELAKAKIDALLQGLGFSADTIQSVLPSLVPVINGWVKTLQAAGWFPKASGLTGTPANG